MNRRSLLGFLVMAITSPQILAATKTAKNSWYSYLYLTGRGRKIIALSPGEAHVVTRNTEIYLPENPIHGCSVQIVVDQSTLEAPCVLKSKKDKITGDSEELVLDSIANFRLLYDQSSKNWRLI